MLYSERHCNHNMLQYNYNTNILAISCSPCIISIIYNLKNFNYISVYFFIIHQTVTCLKLYKVQCLNLCGLFWESVASKQSYNSAFVLYCPHLLVCFTFHIWKKLKMRFDHRSLAEVQLLSCPDSLLTLRQLCRPCVDTVTSLAGCSLKWTDPINWLVKV